MSLALIGSVRGEESSKNVDDEKNALAYPAAG